MILLRDSFFNFQNIISFFALNFLFRKTLYAFSAAHNV